MSQLNVTKSWFFYKKFFKIQYRYAQSGAVLKVSDFVLKVHYVQSGVELKVNNDELP
ncbi:hypothetical protein [Lentisphaera araneosa]|uniref:hypothetical protein n=1 Tax=Lentisphaera araneosa TaxID=256847 RepID=UPI00138A510C|nr:hypothetical protein [Lentisphaera araneosa]